jgi:hypothetical protein
MDDRPTGNQASQTKGFDPSIVVLVTNVLAEYPLSSLPALHAYTDNLSRTCPQPKKGVEKYNFSRTFGHLGVSRSKVFHWGIT